jgi:hypothetical protein
LSAGDIIITCYDTTRDFHFAALVDIPEGTNIVFTDVGLDSDGELFIDDVENNPLLDIFEFSYTYTVPSGGLTAGTQVELGKEEIGDFTWNFVFGDQILVYTESLFATQKQFIGAISFETGGWSDSPRFLKGESKKPPGLEFDGFDQWNSWDEVDVDVEIQPKSIWGGYKGSNAAIWKNVGDLGGSKSQLEILKDVTIASEWKRESAFSHKFTCPSVSGPSSDPLPNCDRLQCLAIIFEDDADVKPNCADWTCFL